MAQLGSMREAQLCADTRVRQRKSDTRRTRESPCRTPPAPQPRMGCKGPTRRETAHTHDGYGILHSYVRVRRGEKC